MLETKKKKNLIQKYLFITYYVFKKITSLSCFSIRANTSYLVKITRKYHTWF